MDGLAATSPVSYTHLCFVNSEIINQIVMELVVIEKNAYLQLKLQIESLSAQIESCLLYTSDLLLTDI